MLAYLILIFCKQQRKIAAVFIFFLAYFIPNIVNAQNGDDIRLKTVVIDAGHGGKDSGAKGKKGREKDIVLKIALKVGGYIEKNLPDVNVIYTRKTDVFVPLDERAAIANKNNADLFLSIHVNSNPDPRPYGTETYTMGEHKSEENLRVAQLENKAILHEENYLEKYSGYDPNSAQSFIIFSLFQRSFLEQSVDFAGYVQKEFKVSAKRRDRGVRQAGFLVLWQTTMPSVLIEAGFISNTKEEKYLLTDEGQTALALSIYKAFKSYKEWYDDVNRVDEIAGNKESDSKDSIVEKKVDKKDIVKETDINQSNHVVFKIQISSSSKPIPLSDNFFNGLDDVDEIVYNGLYKYTIGGERSFKDIIKEKNAIKDRFPDAFIIALKNGKIIPLNEALKEINK